MAVFAGGAARRPAELPRKVAGVGKGISDGDVGNRLVGGGKHPCGRHDAPVHAIFHGPAMQIPLEQPLADPRADMGRPGQFRHGYFAFQMPVDPGQQGLHALLLLRGGGGGLYALGLVLNLLCSLWGVGVGLYNGFTFNRHYFEHVRGNAAAPTRPGLMGIALAVQAVAGIALAAVMLAGLGTELGRGIRSEVGGLLDNSMPYEDVQGGGHSDPQGKYDALFAAILDGHADAAETVQDYTQGYTVPRAWPAGTPNDMVLRASRLFADDDISLGTLVSAMNNTVWSEEYAADEGTDGWNSQLLYGEVGETAVQLEFSRRGELVRIISAITYLVDDDDLNSYYELTQEELAAFVQWLYEQAGTQGGGMAARVRGTWADGAGQQLQITPGMLGGEGCELWFVENGALVLRLDSGAYRRLALSQGDTVLTVSECDEDGAETAPGSVYYKM